MWQLWQIGDRQRIKPVLSVGVKYTPEPELTTEVRLFITRVKGSPKFRGTGCLQRNTGGGEGESPC